MTATVDGQGTRLPAVDTSEQALARLTATLAATAGHYDRTAGFPWKPVRAVHEAGLLSLGVAPEYGGARLTIPELARVLQALGQGGPSVALLTAMTIRQHLQQARLRKWPDALYRQVVAGSVKRPVLLNAVRSEPELGTPTRGGMPATKATRTANGRRTLGVLQPSDQTQRQRNPRGQLAHHGSVWSTMEDRHYHEHATRTHVGRPSEEEAMGAIHDWATPENLQPEPITVEIWRELPEEFCRQVEVVNGQAVRCEAPRRTHQAAARRLATVLDSAAADYVALHPGSCLDVSNDFDVILWEVPTATIRRPDLALHNRAPDDVRPLPASYIRVIIEVVSPGSDKTDRVEKMGEYALAGIPFYWLVWISDNRVASIDVYVLDHAVGAYRLLRTLGPEDELSVLEVPVRIKVPWSELSALVR